MALKVVTGGTTGAANGTLVSSGNPLVIVTLNTAVDAHIRCDDGYWSNDQDFDVPAQLEVSFDGGSTWYGNADEPITAPEIYAVNYPIKIRQVTSAPSTSGSFTTDGTYTAITALGQVTGASVTRTSSTVSDLSWSALTNRTYYKIERATEPDFSTGLTTLSSTATATTYSDTTCSAGVTYYYRITGIGTGRYSNGTASSTLTSVDPTVVSYFPAFDGQLNNLGSAFASWSSLRSGTGTKAVDKTASNDLIAYGQRISNAPYLQRGFITFDTSGLPDGATIVSARLRLWVTNLYTTLASSLCVVASTQASATDLATSDWTAVGTTELITRASISGLTTGQYNNLSLNASGLAAISKTGYTKFAFLISQDVDNTDITNSATDFCGVKIDMSEFTGTSHDPILEVTYT